MATTNIQVTEGSGKYVVFDHDGGGTDRHVQVVKLALQTADSVALAPSAASIPCSTVTLTNLSSSGSSQQLLASNTNRRGLVVMNDSSATLLLKFGTTASATSFTYKIPAGGTLELNAVVIYTGRIDAIWDTADGSARITEIEGV